MNVGWEAASPDLEHDRAGEGDGSAANALGVLLLAAVEFDAEQASDGHMERGHVGARIDEGEESRRCPPAMDETNAQCWTGRRIRLVREALIGADPAVGNRRHR